MPGEKYTFVTHICLQILVRVFTEQPIISINLSLHHYKEMPGSENPSFVSGSLPFDENLFADHAHSPVSMNSILNPDLSSPFPNIPESSSINTEEPESSNSHRTTTSSKVKKPEKKRGDRKEFTVERRIHMYGFHDGVSFYQKEMDAFYKAQLAKIESEPSFSNIRTKLKNLVKPPKITLQKQAEALGCKSGTYLSTIDRRASKPDGNSMEKPAHRNRKIPTHMAPTIVQFVNSNPQMTRLEVIEHFGLLVSLEGLRLFLKKNGYVPQRGTKTKTKPKQSLEM